MSMMIRPAVCRLDYIPILYYILFGLLTIAHDGYFESETTRLTMRGTAITTLARTCPRHTPSRGASPG